MTNMKKFIILIIIFLLNTKILDAFQTPSRNPQWLYNQIDPGNRRKVPGPSQIFSCSSGNPFYQLGCPQGEYPSKHCWGCYGITDANPPYGTGGTKWAAYCAGCGDNGVPNVINNLDQCVGNMSNYQWDKDYQYYGSGGRDDSWCTNNRCGGVLTCAPAATTENAAKVDDCDATTTKYCEFYIDKNGKPIPGYLNDQAVFPATGLPKDDNSNVIVPPGYNVDPTIGPILTRKSFTVCDSGDDDHHYGQQGGTVADLCNNFLYGEMAVR